MVKYENDKTLTIIYIKLISEIPEWVLGHEFMSVVLSLWSEVKGLTNEPAMHQSQFLFK